MTDTVSYPYPENLMDQGYPTQEALDYIKNWSILTIDGEIKFGQFFMNKDMTDLIEYVKSIWTYDTIKEEDGLLEIHTVGWSGNEEIIQELEKTNLWFYKHRATQAGGHYYFRIDSKSKEDWTVTKEIARW